MDVPVTDQGDDHLTVECDLPIVDSGTESFTESPNPDEESDQSEQSTICDLGELHLKMKLARVSFMVSVHRE